MKDVLQEMNSQGFLCGSLESWDGYCQRIETLKQLSNSSTLQSILGEISRCAYPARITYKDLDLDINWLPICISKKKLFLWEPAATWICSIEGVSVPVIQLKSKKQKIKEEILKHEIVHAVRSAFKEPIYEEFLAYATSGSKWRKILGPLFRFPKEALFFAFLSFLPLIGSLFPYIFIPSIMPLLLFIIYLLCRLSINYCVFKKALKRIESIFDVEIPLTVAIRLLDNEIKLFGSMDLKQIKDYVKKQKCLRWKQILLSYKVK